MFGENWKPNAVASEAELKNTDFVQPMDQGSDLRHALKRAQEEDDAHHAYTSHRQKLQADAVAGGLYMGYGTEGVPNFVNTSSSSGF